MIDDDLLMIYPLPNDIDFRQFLKPQFRTDPALHEGFDLGVLDVGGIGMIFLGFDCVFVTCIPFNRLYFSK